MMNSTQRTEIAYRVMYRFNLGNSKSNWYFLMETADIFEAKTGVKRMKNHLGKSGGNVKIVKTEA